MNITSIQPLNEKKYLYVVFATILSAVLLMASFGPSILASASDDDNSSDVSWSHQLILVDRKPRINVAGELMGGFQPPIMCFINILGLALLTPGFDICGFQPSQLCCEIPGDKHKFEPAPALHAT